MVHEDRKKIQSQNANENCKKVSAKWFRSSTQVSSSNIVLMTEKGQERKKNTQDNENDYQDNKVSFRFSKIVTDEQVQLMDRHSNFLFHLQEQCRWSMTALLSFRCQASGRFWESEGRRMNSNCSSYQPVANCGYFCICEFSLSTPSIINWIFVYWGELNSNDIFISSQQNFQNIFT